jgi:hypothetical protein
VPLCEGSSTDAQRKSARGFRREFAAVDTRPDVLNDHASSVAEHLVTRYQTGPGP